MKTPAPICFGFVAKFRGVRGYEVLSQDLRTVYGFVAKAQNEWIAVVFPDGVPPLRNQASRFVQHPTSRRGRWASRTSAGEAVYRRWDELQLEELPPAPRPERATQGVLA